MYLNSGGFSGIGNKNMSLSLFAAFASSAPQNPFLTASLPYFPLNFSYLVCTSSFVSSLKTFGPNNGSSDLASAGSLWPIKVFHLVIGESNLISSWAYSSQT
jgi:hypothetical protein